MHHSGYLHGYHRAVPLMAPIAPIAPVSRFTSRSTASAPDPLILLLYVTSPARPAYVGSLGSAAQVVPFAEFAERSQVFEMPDLAAMPTAATNDWLAPPIPGSSSRSPGCDREHGGSREDGAGGARTHDWRIMRSTARHIARTTRTDTAKRCRS